MSAAPPSGNPPPTTPSRPEGLILYLRHGCHLCEDMQAALADFGLRAPQDLTLVDVDSDPALAERYGSLVPVLHSPQGELCHYFLDALALQRYMENTGFPQKPA